MKNFILAVTIMLSLASCEKKVDQNIDIQSSKTDSTLIPEITTPIESSTLQSCFVGFTGKDSIFVSLDDNLGTITGKMYFKNNEKDSSIGDLMGTKSGDTLKLYYTFSSEGSNSEREIYFLKKDGNLIEGIGEHAVENSKDSYTTPTKLKYTTPPLKQADCEDFDKNFKNISEKSATK